ncbi:MAG TPA: peptide-methionine (S)-S-oxide reductase MsrA [Spirochaetia bacterium]|nr:peptide-methionine (S)-S-oxide reductase MsrA [Spirochaetia bacterium]
MLTTKKENAGRAHAVIGGGCFWCVEAVYRRVDGITDVESGYAGGTVDHPSYEQVCTGKTGHAEVVRVEYDPSKIGYSKVLDLFFLAHDPTTLNRQGADTGTQYRSIILYATEDEKRIAGESVRKAQANLTEPIVTEIVPLEKFWPAEDYHRDYFERNPTAGYCRLVIKPKIDKLDLGPRRNG